MGTINIVILVFCSRWVSSYFENPILIHSIAFIAGVIAVLTTPYWNSNKDISLPKYLLLYLNGVSVRPAIACYKDEESRTIEIAQRAIFIFIVIFFCAVFFDNSTILHGIFYFTGYLTIITSGYMFGQNRAKNIKGMVKHFVDGLVIEPNPPPRI